MSIIIDYMDYYIPGHRESVDSILEKNDINVEEFKKKSGFEEVGVFGEYELPEVLDGMFEKMVREKDMDLSMIKYIACETNPLTKYYNMSIVHMLKKKYNMNNAKILPIHQPCATSLCAMELATKVLEESDYMIVVCANDWSREVFEKRFSRFTIMGDGIGLALIKNGTAGSGSIQIQDWYYENYGLSSYNVYKGKHYGNEPSLNRVSMVRKGVRFILDNLEKSNLELADFEKIIVSNVSNDVYAETYSMLLGISADQFYLENTGDGAHMNDIDLIRNLKDYLGKNNVQEKERLLAVFTSDIEESMDINYHLIILKI